MLSITLAATLSFLSAVIVAILGHFFSIKRKRRDDLLAMRLKACTDFINALARLASARRKGLIEDELNELATLNDAKIRICICADKKVVEALAKFWGSGGTLEDEREILAFTTFCYRVRESLGNKAWDIVDLRISDTLFKLEPSHYSFRVDEQRGNLPENKT